MLPAIQYWLKAQARSITSVIAWSGTFLFHIALVALLWQETRVVAPQRMGSSITLYLQTEAAPVPPAPPRPPDAAARARGTPANPAPATAKAPRANVAASAPIEAAPEPALSTLSERLSAQRREAAIEIARENAPARRPFRERSLDAMVPDAGNGKLPGFHPRTADDKRDMLRRLGQILSQGIPSAAMDPHSHTDLLTEGWEAKHHGSDMAACERQYEELDADLRRQMCGDVRPPQN